MSITTDNYVLRLYKRMLGYPMGRFVFSRFAARKARYFTSISPSVERLEQNYCEILVRKRKAVTNHIGTVHVIAIANGLEMAMGALTEASIPDNLRWIPKGMTLQYVSKGTTDIRCAAQVPPDIWQPGEISVAVMARDTAGNEVVTGHIQLWITEKPTRQA